MDPDEHHQHHEDDPMTESDLMAAQRRPQMLDDVARRVERQSRGADVAA